MTCNCHSTIPKFGEPTEAFFPSDLSIGDGEAGDAVQDAEFVWLTDDGGVTKIPALAVVDTMNQPPTIVYYDSNGAVIDFSGYEIWDDEQRTVEHDFCVVDATGATLRRHVVSNDTTGAFIVEFFFDPAGNPATPVLPVSPCSGNSVSEHVNDFSGANTITAATLLGIDAGDDVHMVQFSVLDSASGVIVTTGNSTATLQAGESTKLKGEIDQLDSGAIYHPVSDFTLTMVAGDIVRVNYVIINPV